MTTNRVWNRLFPVAVMLLATLSAGRATAAGDVAGTQRARNGGGLVFSTWEPEKTPGVTTSGLLAIQGYFEKGLDLHLAWQNTLGYWRRTEEWTTSSFTGTTTHEIQTHLVPTLTSLRVYPFTTPEDRIEPYLNAGLGVVLGLQQEKVRGDINSLDSGMSMHTGLGLRAGAGVQMRANDAFGFMVGARFESASFGEEKPGTRLYKGFGGDLGITYRFQYR